MITVTGEAIQTHSEQRGDVRGSEKAGSPTGRRPNFDAAPWLRHR